MKVFKRRVSLNFISSAVCINSFILLCVAGCSSSSFEKQTSAQTNLNAQVKEATQKEFEFIRLVGDPCPFLKADGYEKPGYKQIYELKNAGYPKEVSLEEAVAVANTFAQCSETGKTQPSLRAEEIVASIRSWVCERDAPFDDKKKACEEFWQIAETGKMPKGSFIYLEGGGSYDYRGYDTDAWEIYLNIRLDKHRADFKDVPSYPRLVRLNYISSKLAQKKFRIDY